MKGKEYVTHICNACINARQKAYTAKKKSVVYDHYGRVCNCCGETTLEFLSIDHVNNDGNLDKHPGGEYRITGQNLYSKIIRLKFPSSYQILCMNCNFGKKMNDGVCPHIAEKV